MVHDLNQKNLHIKGFFLFAKSKKLFFGMFLGIISKMRFFSKNPAVSFLPLRHPKFQKNPEPFWTKPVYLLT